MKILRDKFDKGHTCYGLNSQPVGFIILLLTACLLILPAGAVLANPQANSSYTVRRLTNGNTEDSYPNFSLDGKQIVFSSKKSKFRNIWVMDADGKNRRQLTFGSEIKYTDPMFERNYTADVAPVFTPDGKRIVFASNRETTTWNIWSVGVDGSGLTRLTKEGSNEFSPSVSADGKRIAFVSTKGGSHSVWMMERDGNNARRITSGGTGDWFPSMNPDGREIVFVSTRLGNGDIWTVDTEGKNYKRLTHKNVPEFSPAWSPDGTKIAYVTKKGKEFDIWVMDRDGGNKRRLTNGISGGDWGTRFSAVRIIETAGYYHLSWHPDGTKMLFTTWEPDKKGSYISVLELSNEAIGVQQEEDTIPEYTLIGERELTKGDWEDFGPSFSPDGNTIIFASNKSGNWDVWRIKSSEFRVQSSEFKSEEPVQLTKNSVDELAPTFSPDGKEIAFLSATLNSQLATRNYSLWIMKSDGSEARQLTKDIPVLSYPAWSPDGKDISFVSERNEGHEIWTYNIADSTTKKITSISDFGFRISDLKSPIPNPQSAIGMEFLYRLDYNNDRITFESNQSGNIDIWTMQRDGTELTRITKGDMPHWNPVFSPDGKKIAYTTAKYGEPAGHHNWTNYNIWIADTETRQEMLITGEEQTDWNPVFSPDGKRIAYVTNRSGDFKHFSLWMLYLK